MSAPWLLLDAPYLCYRAFFSTGALSYKDTPTGVVYGVLKQIQPLQDLFLTDRVAFCFDHGKSRRAKIYPNYKANRRKTLTMDEEKALSDMREQVRLLRLEYLPAIGFRNIFWQDGFEADDCIAQLCKQLSTDSAIIISADQDLFQLLSNRVTMWNPYKKKKYTHKWFEDEYNLTPDKWSLVKAIAGCASDNIIGIRGVGEKTAANYLSNMMVVKGKKYEDICSNWDLVEKNHMLTKLPFPGTKPLPLVKDEVTLGKWNEVTGELGMKSLQEVEKGFGLA